MPTIRSEKRGKVVSQVLYEEKIDKSYSILDVEIRNDEITFCETWGGPKIKNDFGDFDVEWFVTISGQQHAIFIKKLCKKANVPVIEITDNQKIVDLISIEFGNQASSITPLKNWLEQENISYQFDQW